MTEPRVQVDISVTITMTHAQARDVMDDLLSNPSAASDHQKFSSDGSRDVYNALARAVGARIL